MLASGREPQGEEGIDAGGVTREWYQVMAREMFNPNLALFVAVPDGGSTFQPNPNSHVQNDRGISHLDYFRFVGRIVGKVGPAGSRTLHSWHFGASGPPFPGLHRLVSWCVEVLLTLLWRHRHLLMYCVTHPIARCRPCTTGSSSTRTSRGPSTSTCWGRR